MIDHVHEPRLRVVFVVRLVHEIVCVCNGICSAPTAIDNDSRKVLLDGRVHRLHSPRTTLDTISAHGMLTQAKLAVDLDADYDCGDGEVAVKLALGEKHAQLSFKGAPQANLADRQG